MKKLRVLRIIAGKTQRELARDAGLSQTLVSFVENGRRLPSEQTLEKLSEALARALKTDVERVKL